MSRFIVMFFCAIIVQMELGQSLDSDACPEIGEPHLKIKKDGRGKARDHCIDWIELNYPCVSSNRIDKCHITKPAFVPSRHLKKDHPHAVLLGYTSENKEVNWLCSATLISDQWVMASAHCSRSRNYGNVTKARMAVNVDNQHPNHDYDIVEIRIHPNYKFKSFYYDIALMKLGKRVELSSDVVPACLDYEGLEPKKGIETGFYIYDDSSNNMDIYQMSLDSVNSTQCSEIYPPSRRLNTGIDHGTQICYRNTGQTKDTCSNEISGQIQVLNENVHCTYTVFGIPSFGRICGANAASVFTRVEPYLKWIEEIVWP